MKYRLVFSFLLFSIGLTTLVDAQNSKEKFIVILDAGHGGGDPGNLGNGYKEKDIALKVALEVGKALEDNPNIKVIYTRKTDVFLELYERADIANKADADLFVSIHCNSHHTQASGTETFVLGAANTERNFAVAKKENEVIFLEDNYEKNYAGFDPSSPESTIAIGIEQEIYVEQSIVLARKIEDNFVKDAKRKSRGLKQASLLVIRNTYMPSVLVELGFLTNNNEGPYLNSKSGQHKMANAIEKAIIGYKNELDQNIGDRFILSSNEVKKNTPLPQRESRYIPDVTFKVQIAASSRKLETKSYNFKGLTDISREKSNNLYKYYYGETSDFVEIQNMKLRAAKGGYGSCFVVAFKDGKQISVEEALKSNSN